MKQVLVLDSSQRSALAVTRSLGRRGIHVLTADEIDCSLAGASRYSQQQFTYPSPLLDTERFVEYLHGIIERNSIELVIPMTELTTEILLQNQSMLGETTIPFADKAKIDSLSDKSRLVEIAKKLGVPVPATQYIHNPKSDPVRLEDLAYPVALKPSRSWLFHRDRWSRVPVRIARNQAEARDYLARDVAFREHPFMIQEFIEGYGKGLFTLYNKGAPVAFFSHRRLREKPPGGGVSVLSESIEVDPLLMKYSRALLDSVGWHGVAMVEFRVSQENVPYLMEVNTRFWGSLQLSIDAGIDFPWLLYQVSCNSTPKLPDSYRTGIRLRWLLGDLDSLYLTLKDDGYSTARKLAAIRDFLTPSPFRTKHEINRWNDLGPALRELRHYMHDLFA